MEGVGKIVRVVGTSMAPYLVEGDLVSYQEVTTHSPLPPGTVVLVQATPPKQLLIHRVVSQNPLRIKGDQTKNHDHRIYDELLVIGQVTHRVDASVSPAFTLHRVTGGVISKWIACLSQFNRHPFIGFHHLVYKMIQVLGWWSRRSEIANQDPVTTKRWGFS